MEVEANMVFQTPDTVAGAQGKKGRAGLQSEDIDSWLTDVDFNTIFKEFVHPGDDVGQLLMRTFFIDEEQASAVACYLSLCDEIDYTRGKKRLLYKLAANCSIKSRRILMLLMAVTRRLEPALLSDNGAKFRQYEREQGRPPEGP